MQTRQLGTSDLHTTPIGFGAWAIGGGDWAYAWGRQDDEESIQSIRRALDAGINWIDTAAIYGLGHSEEVVARALEGRSSKPYIFTKCGMVWNEQKEITHSLRADSIRRECEASLQRLKVDAIDLYQIHWNIPDEQIEEGWTTLAGLQREGKVRYIGVSNFTIEQMRRAQAIAPVTSLQPPYSILARGIEKDALPFCRENSIGVLVYSPMKSGLLTGAMTRERIAAFPEDDWRRNNTEFQEPKLSRNLAIVEGLRDIGARHGRTPGEVAIAWTLRIEAVTAAIVGVRRPSQVAGIIGAGEFRLSDDEACEIEALLA